MWTQAADLEAAPWPFPPGRFDGVVVTNYLHRPLFGDLVAALRPGGVLIYETFMLGNEALGRPSNPDFLLRPGELLEALRGRLTVVAFEQGRVDGAETGRDPAHLCGAGRGRVCNDWLRTVPGSGRNPVRFRISARA